MLFAPDRKKINSVNTKNIVPEVSIITPLYNSQ